MVRVRIKSDAPLFSAEDYSYIMQCRDIKPRYKILNELMDKYKTSTKRIYQIWRGEESNRVLWDQPIPHFYDDDSNRNTNVPNSTMNVLHIESQPLDKDKVPLLCNNVSAEVAQPNKRIKIKRSKPSRISNPPIIAKDSTEKTGGKPLYSENTLASFKCAVEESKKNLSNL